MFPVLYKRSDFQKYSSAIPLEVVFCDCFMNKIFRIFSFKHNNCFRKKISKVKTCKEIDQNEKKISNKQQK